MTIELCHAVTVRVTTFRKKRTKTEKTDQQPRRGVPPTVMHAATMTTSFALGVLLELIQIEQIDLGSTDPDRFYPEKTITAKSRDPGPE